MNKSRRLGPLAATAFRTVVVFVSLLITAAASLILVRRLDAASYAAFQTLTRRIVMIARFPIGVLGFWIYRYVAQGIRGSIGAGILVSLFAGAFSAIVGLISALWLQLGTLESLLASAALGVFLLHQGLLNIINAARPLRHPLVIFTYRLLYSIGVVVLVYFIHKGLEGALASLVIAAMVAASLSALWLKEKVSAKPLPLREYIALIIEWIRGSSASVAPTIGLLIASLDAMVAYTLSDENVVAAYFVARIPFSLMIDAFSVASMYLAGFLLGGGSVHEAILSIRLTLLMVAFVSGFVAANPGPITYVLNPSYYWAANAMAIMAVAAYFDVLSRGLLNILTGTVKGRVAESVTELRALGARVILANTLYIILEAIALTLAETPVLRVTVWIASYMVSTILLTILLILRAPKSLRSTLKENLHAILLYPFIAFASSLLFGVDAYHTRFWAQVRALLPSLSASLIFYVIILMLLDPFFRRILRRGVRLAMDIISNFE